MNKARLFLYLYGGFCVFAVLLWAFSGLPLWAEPGDKDFRGFVLFVAMFVGIFGFIAACNKDLW